MKFICHYWAPEGFTIEDDVIELESLEELGKFVTAVGYHVIVKENEYEKAKYPDIGFELEVYDDFKE